MPYNVMNEVSCFANKILGPEILIIEEYFEYVLISRLSVLCTVFLSDLK